MISFFDEPFVNDTRIEDNLFSINPYEGIFNINDTNEGIFNINDTNEDIYPNLGGQCDFFLDNYTNSNTVINEQGNNHTNNNQINSIINNNDNISNSNNNNSNNNNIISNNNNNNNSNNNNYFLSNYHINDLIPISNGFNNYYLIENFRFKPRKKERIKDIKDKLTKTKFIKSLNKDKDCCIICLQEFKNNQNIYKLSCSHIFHIRCLNKEIKYRKKCPMCRKKF